jgi:hypothetical protein
VRVNLKYSKIIKNNNFSSNSAFFTKPSIKARFARLAVRMSTRDQSDWTRQEIVASCTVYLQSDFLLDINKWKFFWLLRRCSVGLFTDRLILGFLICFLIALNLALIIRYVNYILRFFIVIDLFLGRIQLLYFLPNFTNLLFALNIFSLFRPFS